MLSLLDNDLYKFSQQAAVLHHYPEVDVEYKFINRRPEGMFTKKMVDKIRQDIARMADHTLSSVSALGDLDKFKHLKYCRFLNSYSFKMNPDLVNVEYKDGELELFIRGKWVDTILFEVPIMATISEVYFAEIDADKSHDFKAGYEVRDAIVEKIKILEEGNCLFSDFGTRRRRSAWHHIVGVTALKNSKNFIGSSNVELSRSLQTPPIGTMAHEWIMGVSVLESQRHANRYALRKWYDTFEGDFGIALTDTYGTDAFLNDFDFDLADKYNGVRHDSGCPFKFTDKIINHYIKLGIDPRTKKIVFSDGLSPQKAVEIQKYVDGRIPCVFGIGTNFTNDVPDSPALNMVIKLTKCNGIPVVKLSDEPGKVTGDPDAVKVAKWTFLGEKL